MSERPTLRFLTRSGCSLCEDGRAALQVVLEDRARNGETVPVLREIDVDSSPDLAARYGAHLPVLTLGDSELTLAAGAARMRRFLDRSLGRLV